MKLDIVRAWKDAEYRKTLSAEELAIAGNPVAAVELETLAGEGNLTGRFPPTCGSQTSRVRTKGRCCC